MTLKVTKALNQQWALQRGQLIEKREFDQDGRPRTPAGVAEADAEIANMDSLLALPIGALLK